MICSGAAATHVAKAGRNVSEMVILFGLARRTARKSRKYHYFTRQVPLADLRIEVMPRETIRTFQTVRLCRKRATVSSQMMTKRRLRRAHVEMFAAGGGLDDAHAVVGSLEAAHKVRGVCKQ